VLLYERAPRGGLRVVAYTAALRRGKREPSAGVYPGMPLAEAVALHEHAAWRRARDRAAERSDERKAVERSTAGLSTAGLSTAGLSTAGLSTDERDDRGADAGEFWPLWVEACDPVADRQALGLLAQRLQQFSPLVGCEEAPRPESLLLDITGLAGLFGGEQRLAARVERAVSRGGFSSRLAIADTPGAAWALAHYGASPATTGDAARNSASKHSAAGHSASRRSAAGRFWIAPPGGTRAALAPLPVAALRLSDPTVELLAELGVRRIGPLLALSRTALHSRFGPETLRRVDETLAAAADVVTTHKTVEPPRAERALEFPTDRRDVIEAISQPLLAGLTAALAGRGEGILRLECRLGRQGAEAIGFEVGLFRPAACARHVLELVRLRLDALEAPATPREALWSREAPVESVRFTVTAAANLGLEQRRLFAADDSRAAPRELAALVDRLASRLGRQAVARPVAVADAQPEYACQYPPLDEPAHRPTRRSRPAARRLRPPASSLKPQASSLAPGARPLRLLATAEPLAATSTGPDGPPAKLDFAGHEERITRAWGPERIETGWWRGRCVRRDYYRVETARGSRFWVFRRLTDGRWFLHGEFE